MPLLHVQAGSADQLQDIADALWKARKVVVITGAGISTNSGIPDFRSENGLYSMIQSQFDAASKLGIPKAETVVASDERPRKRRKITPPVQDTIEVAPEHSAESASPSEPNDFPADAEQSPRNVDSNTEAVSISVNRGTAPKREAVTTDHGDETADAVEEEVVLLSDESVLADESNLFGNDRGSNADGSSKEEAPDPPNGLARESSQTHEQRRTTHATPIAASHVASPKRPSTHRTPAVHCLSLATRPPQEGLAQQSLAVRATNDSTPKPASNSGPQTMTSSPLSSPPPGELFDSFDEQMTDPPLSSSRPSSPVSVENDEGKHDEDDDIEPSWCQDYANRSSNFRRSLSTLKGKELFDASIWSDPLKTSVFYTFATNLRQRSRDADPTGCHQFIGHLSKAGKMVRCYTQNIDLLEDKVGLSTRLLLGAGSRSRFSTRAARGLAVNLSAIGPREPSQTNAEPALVPTLSCSGAPSQLAVVLPAASQTATPSSSQGTSSQTLEEINIVIQQNSDNEGRVHGSEDQGGERGEACEHEGVKPEAQPAFASLTASDKPLPRTDCASPTTPTTSDRDKGVECVFLHGSLRALRCFQCGCVADWEGERELQTMSGHQPPCPRCEDATNARQERGKRALGVGKLRPDIVLYGEDHPESQQISSIIQHDISLAPDMLIIMGTSLKVHGLKTVVKEFAKTVHNRKDGKVIFVNYTKPAESVWADVIDFWVQMDCDSWVEDLKEKKPIIWMPPGSMEDEPRITTSKRRRPLTDETDKMEAKKPKKAEDVAKQATTATTKEKSKKPRPVKKGESSTATDGKPHMPKRPAAHRDCKQNAAYWTLNILDNLANMTGRVVRRGPQPYRTALAPPITAVETSAPAAHMHIAAPGKARRGPRTKNTISRKVHETAGSSSTSQEKRKRKRPKSQGAAVAKAPSKRRTQSSGPATTLQASGGAIGTKSAFSLKQESEASLDVTALAEVPIPNSGPSPGEKDVPMVSVVKNRVRKPKIFYGDATPLSNAPTRRGTPAVAKRNASAGSQAKETQAGQVEELSRPDDNQGDAVGAHEIELRFLPPIIQPRPVPHATFAEGPPIQLEPLRPIDHQAINARRNSFYQAARGQSGSPDTVSAPPEYLEPVVSPGPHDMSPKLSPNHWQRRAFSYSNALFRTPLDYPSRRRSSTDGAVHTHQAVQQTALGDAPQLLFSPSIVPNLPAPAAASLVRGDSPNRQLQRETEAAAALLAVYDQRHFARI